MDNFEQHIKRMKGLRDVYEVGTGQHNILSMLINECEAALLQPHVSGRSEQLACIHKLERLRLIGGNITCLDCQSIWVRQAN